MNLDIFNTMDESELRQYLEFLLRHYRLIDSFWFISVEDGWGREDAEEINGHVWSCIGPMAAIEIRNRYHIQEKGLEGFTKTLKLFPWTNISGHQIEQRGDEVILSAPHCPPQIARVKKGQGEYDCRDMHMDLFRNFAKQVDPQILVHCEFAPPDPHPDHLFCKWRFTIS